MCRGRRTCNLLPRSTATLDPRSPLRPPAWFQDSAWLVRDALIAARAGNLRAARVLIAATREAELREFFVEHAQNTYRYRVPLIDAELGRAPRERIKPENKDALRLPNASATRTLYLRDGHRCRYCDGEVFPQAVLKELHRLMPAELPVGAGNSAKHGAYLAFAAVLDHVQPYSAGGRSGEENLVTSCWPCNFGKSSTSLEDLMLDDPRARPPRVNDWDGGVVALDH